MLPHGQPREQISKGLKSFLIHWAKKEPLLAITEYCANKEAAGGNSAVSGFVRRGTMSSGKPLIMEVY